LIPLARKQILLGDGPCGQLRRGRQKRWLPILLGRPLLRAKSQPARYGREQRESNDVSQLHGSVVLLARGYS